MTENKSLKLDQAWEQLVVPDMEEIASTTIEEYRGSLRIWKRLSGDPDISAIDRETVKAFRTKLVSTPYKRGKVKVAKRSAATVNRIMRDMHVVMSPFWPADRTNPSGLNLMPFFKWPRSLSIQRKLPFVYSMRDLSKLYLNADACRQTPRTRRTPLNEPRLWRLALVLGLNCGARTWDLFQLKISDVNLEPEKPFRYGSIVFSAVKTGKLHRIPLNKYSARHLKDYLKNPVQWKRQGDRLFPGFCKGKAFYATWKRIGKAANVVGTFEAMRKTCVTHHNSVIWESGYWLTGHIAPGVFGHYDNPSARIFQSVYKLRNPAEFVRGAKSLLAIDQQQSSSQSS